MGIFNIKVTEYGIKRGNQIKPNHYNWNYCIEKKIPYILVHPKTRYSKIEYDLLTIDDGINFKNEHRPTDFWCDYYDNYIIESKLPKSKIKLVGGNISVLFTIRLEDQNKILSLMMSKIEEYVNSYGFINSKSKEYYAMTREINIKNKQREEFINANVEEIPI